MYVLPLAYDGDDQADGSGATRVGPMNIGNTMRRSLRPSDTQANSITIHDNIVALESKRNPKTLE